LRWVEGL